MSDADDKILHDGSAVQVHAAGTAPLDEALKNPELVRLYTNGFAVGLGNADAHIVLSQFNQPVAVVSMSFTLAKTLALRLGRLVAEWEARTGQQLMTTDKLDLAFRMDSSEETKQ